MYTVFIMQSYYKHLTDTAFTRAKKFLSVYFYLCNNLIYYFLIKILKRICHFYHSCSSKFVQFDLKINKCHVKQVLFRKASLHKNMHRKSVTIISINVFDYYSIDRSNNNVSHICQKFLTTPDIR